MTGSSCVDFQILHQEQTMNRRSFLALSTAAGLLSTLPAHAQTQPNALEMPKMLTPKSSGYAPVNGVKLWYQTYGEGKPLVLLHGGFTTTEMFMPILPALAAGRQVIGVELQGHGRTGPLGRPMTVEAMATDIAELIRHLGHEKADIMGYSLGGNTAIRTAIDHPEVVDHLVAVSSVYAFSGWQDYNQQGMKGMAADPVAAAAAMKQTPLYPMYAAVAKDPETTWPKAVAEIVALVGQDFDWSAEIPKITAKTLLVVGDWDAIHISLAARFFELLGGSKQDAMFDRSSMNQNRMAVLPNTTHYESGVSPALPPVVIPFLDGYPAAPVFTG
jgi:pimeloyl-ACP methyl ester carboxylesterase